MKADAVPDEGHLPAGALRSIAAAWGTPGYVYDLETLRLRARELRRSLPEEWRLLYSLKANPHPDVASEVAREGPAAEISSRGEVDVAVLSGFDAEQMLYTGPGKSAEEVSYAIQRGVRWFSCESLHDYQTVLASAQQTDQDVSALLRICPGAAGHGQLSMDAGRQFGMPIEVAAQICARPDSRVKTRGYHVYLGSQMNGLPGLVDAFTHAADLVNEAERQSGIRAEVANLGGGFPWPYATSGAGALLGGLVEALPERVQARNGRAVWCESGRRVAGQCGHLLLGVRSVFHRSGTTFVIVDGGINTIGGLSGLGRVLRPNLAVVNLAALERGSNHSTDVVLVGPLCTPLDRLSARTTVTDPRPGDLLAVANVGAYGATASLTGFLSRRPAYEIAIDGDTVRGAWRLRGGHERIDPLTSQSPMS